LGGGVFGPRLRRGLKRARPREGGGGGEGGREGVREEAKERGAGQLPPPPCRHCAFNGPDRQHFATASSHLLLAPISIPSHLTAQIAAAHPPPSLSFLPSLPQSLSRSFCLKISAFPKNMEVAIGEILLTAPVAQGCRLEEKELSPSASQASHVLHVVHSPGKEGRREGGKEGEA